MINAMVLDSILTELHKLSPSKFCDLVADHYRHVLGPTDVILGPAGNDSGVDIVLLVPDRFGKPHKYAVECKRIQNSVDKNIVNGLIVIAQGRKYFGMILASTSTPADKPREQIEEARQNGHIVEWERTCGRELVRTLVELSPSVLSSYVDTEQLDEATRVVLGVHAIQLSNAPSFDFVSDRSIIPSPSADSFFNALPPSFGDIAAGFDIERSMYSRANGIWDDAHSFLSSGQGTALKAIVGVDGVGKTTLLRRLGLDACRAGFAVLSLKVDWHVYSQNLWEQIDDVRSQCGLPLLVLVDDGADVVRNTNLLTGMQTRNAVSRPVLIVVSEQVGLWTRVTDRWPTGTLTDNYVEHSVFHLSTSECEELVDQLIALETDGQLTPACSLSRTERLAMCPGPSDRQAIVALFQMRYGLKFREIITREFNRIPDEHTKSIYMAVSLWNIFGITPSRHLVYRSLDMSLQPERQRVYESLSKGLIVEDRTGMRVRHRLIAQKIYTHAFSGTESKRSVLCGLLSQIDVTLKEEAEILVHVCTRPRANRRFCQILLRDEHQIELLFQSIVEALQVRNSNYFLKYVLSCFAMCMKLLNKNEKADSLLSEAISVDSDYAFAFMQKAWIALDAKRYDQAAELAKTSADLADSDFRAQLDCALLLSLNLPKHFWSAESFFKRAEALDPESPQLERRYKRYKDAARTFKPLTNPDENQPVPPFVAKYFLDARLGLSYIKQVFGRNSRQYRQRVRESLHQSLQHDFDNFSDISEFEDDVSNSQSPKIQALWYANVGRLRYLEWYHDSRQHELSEIRSLFESAIQLDPNEPLTRCWFGTFLKEGESDYKRAMIEYRMAFQLTAGKKSRHRDSHPIIPNNLALLIMEDVEFRGADLKSLEEAEALLKIAAEAVQENRLHFPWPKYNLAKCAQLKEELSRQ